MMDKKGVFLLLLVVLSMTLMVAGCGMLDKSANTSQKYPVKPITMIVPYSAGGSSDMMARAIEKAAVKHLGQPLVVTNITGGGATIGWNELAGSKPDGYTIGYVATAIILQPLYNQTRYHYPTALEPLAQIMSMPLVLAVQADQPWTSVEELIAYAKEHPGEIKYGHSGLGTGTHVAGELFANVTGINITQVPFRGEGETVGALLGGHVQLMVTAATTVKEYVKSGKLKVLAVSAEKRLTDPLFKDVPTLKERGHDMVYALWHGVGAPKDLPQDVKVRLADGLRDIANDPDFKKHMEDLGMTVEYLGPQEFGEKWVADNVRLTKIVKETGIAERITAQKN